MDIVGRQSPAMKSLPAVVLWTGAKHSGKTDRLKRLVIEARLAGLTLAGFLAESIYRRDSLRGFDAVDVVSGRRAPLARRSGQDEGMSRRFVFCEEGVALGTTALSRPESRDADLIVIDEYGPMELAGGMWRPAVDLLLSTATGIVVLVVRESLVRVVEKLYSDRVATVVVADAAEAVPNVLDLALAKATSRASSSPLFGRTVAAKGMGHG